MKFKCDIFGCTRKPYMEMYDLKEHSWSYLCFWHYIKDRLKRNDNHGYCRVNTQREDICEILESIFELETEITDIQMKLKEIMEKL